MRACGLGLVLTAASLAVLSVSYAGSGVDLSHPPSIAIWPPETARREMLSEWRRSGRLTVLVEPGDPDALEAYRRLLTSPLGPPGTVVRVIPAAEATAADLAGPLLVAGPGGPAVRACLNATPLRGTATIGPGESLRAIGVNPWRPDSAVLIVTGSDDAAVRDHLARGPWMRGDFEMIRGGMRVRYGRYETGASSKGQPWRIDADSDTDIRGRLAVLKLDGVAVTYVTGEVAERAARSAAESAMKDLRVFEKRLGAAGGSRAGSGHGARLELVLHRDLEAKAVRTGDPRPSHYERGAGGAARVHALVNADGTLADGLGLARAAIAGTVGDVAPRAAADGLALWLADSLLGRPLAWWEARLARSTIRPQAGDLIEDRAYERLSYLLGMTTAAAAVGEMARGRTPMQLGELLRDPARVAAAMSKPPRPGSASDPWLASGHRVEGGAAAGDAVALPFQKGMGLAHEGYAGSDGYGSESAATEMARLARLGVEWIALSPYGFMEDPHAPEILFPRGERQSPGAENDAAVLETARAAHRLGLKVMLKPQIWLHDGHWTGDIAMEDETTWRVFFDRYREFLAHYALLAAAGDMEILVVGVEMQRTTTRQKEWRALIGSARELYGGPLTYAANWGGEFETLGFWEALDYVGLDCYYPLSDAADADDERLLAGAREVSRRIGDVSRRAGRAVILTEAGFPALASSWTAPHDDRTGAPLDPKAQARGYRALLTAIWGKPWLAGIYWWKWPSAPEGSRRDPIFSPRSRPAQDVLTRWYSQPRPAAAHWPARP